MANTIDFNVNTNAVTVLNQTATAADNTAKGFTSAKAELRALNQQLLQMDSSSEEFKKASERAAELKDNISDLSAEISANAGNAFEGLSNNVGLFGSRLMDLDLKGAGQALSGMATAVGKIDFKTLKDEIGGLIQGLGKLAKAVLANPYLMLAAAVALIVANFDTIIKQFPAIEKGLTGINEQERELLDLQTKRAEQAKKNYDNISATENTLKLQGKTEKEIRDMKIAAIQAAIQEAKVRLETQRGQEKAQIETAQRNREILEGFIKWINAPLYLLLSTVDKIAGWVGQTTNLAEGLTTLAADLLIDPKQQQADLQKSFEEQENTIRDMENSLAGFRLEQKKADKDASDKSKKTQEEAAKEALEKEKELKKSLIQIQQDRIAEEERIDEEIYQSSLTAQQKEIDAVRNKYFELITTAQSFGKDASALIEAQAKAEANINKKYADEEAAKKKEADEKKKAEDEKANKEELDRLTKFNEDKLAAEQALTDAKFSIATASVNLLGTLFAKNKKAADIAFALDKALAIAQVVVNTQREISAYNANPVWSLSPDGGASIKIPAIIGAKLRAAASIAAIAGTAIGRFAGGGASGGSGVGATGGGGTAAPSPANFAFVGNQPNQQQPPLQAYVVGTQVSSNLEAQQLIQNQSRLGG
jgi:DNA repair exonuclease SbcCD ATPase subunit